MSFNYGIIQNILFNSWNLPKLIYVSFLTAVCIYELEADKSIPRYGAKVLNAESYIFLKW